MKTTLKAIASGTIMVVFCLFAMSFTIKSVQDQKPAGKPWAAPDNAVKMKNPAKGADALKEGKDLFMQHCKSCHGAKGKGDGPKADKIDISCNDFSKADFAKVSDGELYWKTTEGRKPMPSFKEKLSDSERWSVILFVKSLSGN
jgi:mono/diheme cytochrome c family protein